MRSFDFVFPGTPNLPAHIKAPDDEVAAVSDFIRNNFTDAATSLCNALGIVLPEPVSTSPEVVEPDVVASPRDDWMVAGESDSPTLSPVTGRLEVTF